MVALPCAGISPAGAEVHLAHAPLPETEVVQVSPTQPQAGIEIIGTPSRTAIVTIRPTGTAAARQGLRQFVGISGRNSGARALSMNQVIIPPAGRAIAHRHIGSESAIFLLSGHVRTWYGPCLERSVDNRAGDFLFIPPDLPHMPVNLSATEPAIAIVARSDANEQEQVEVLQERVAGSAAPRLRGCPSRRLP